MKNVKVQKIFSVLVGIFLLNPNAFAEIFEVNKALSHATFYATGKPGFLHITGTGAHPYGKIDFKAPHENGDIYVPISDFVTGIEMRDEHMKGKKYLDVAKYPEAKLSIKNQTVSPLKSGEQSFTGHLTLKGTTKPIQGTINFTKPSSKTSKQSKAEAKFEIVLSDFKIDIPSYAGVKVADKVEITVDITFDQR